jgi:hypothetical protein
VWGAGSAPHAHSCYFVAGGVVGDGLGDGVVGVLGLGDVDGDADGVRSAGRSPRRSDRDSEQAAANVVTRASRQKPESSFFIRYVPP